MKRVEIIGNLGKDAELKTIGSTGTTVANFSVAAKGSRKEDESQWFNCSLFGKRAESLMEWLKKGKQVYIRGELKLRKWDSNGKSGVDLDVNVDEIELLGGGDKKEERGAPF